LYIQRLTRYLATTSKMFIQSTVALGLLANAAGSAFAACGTTGSGQALKALSMDLHNERLDIRGQRKNVEIKTYIHVLAASEKEEDNYLSARLSLVM
jgi:hypothetical protein